MGDGTAMCFLTGTEGGGPEAVAVMVTDLDTYKQRLTLVEDGVVSLPTPGMEEGHWYDVHVLRRWHHGGE